MKKLILTITVSDDSSTIEELGDSIKHMLYAFANNMDNDGITNTQVIFPNSITEIEEITYKVVV